MNLPPLSLYVHIPWCVRKCPYCDFNSHADASPPFDAYVDALLADLTRDAAYCAGRRIDSIFFGGGTPSLLPGQAFTRLMHGIRQHVELTTNCEITLEANPGTVDERHFADYYAAGVNRLSIGVQSFAADALASLGRIHSPQQAEAAFALARSIGFKRINLDLLFGLPGQTLDQGLADLGRAIALEPEHLSWYQLTIEPNTEFHSRPPALPDDEQIVDLYDAGRWALAQHGYTQYEVSAYAKPGEQCRHNRNYWEFGDYLGIGAGAHGKITDAEGRITRYWKTRAPRDYLRRLAADDQQPDVSITNRFTAGTLQLDTRDTIFEFLLNALRLAGGFSRSLYEQRTHQPLTAIAPLLQKQVDDGWMQSTAHDGETWWFASPRGYILLDGLLTRLSTALDDNFHVTN